MAIVITDYMRFAPIWVAHAKSKTCWQSTLRTVESKNNICWKTYKPQQFGSKHTLRN